MEKEAKGTLINHKAIIKTRIIKISAISPDQDVIHEAARLIQSGKLVAFPTETVYGLGADVFNNSAIQSIFTTKQRPSMDPLIVHIENINQLKNVAVNIPDLAFQLAKKYWPGPLTLILKKHPDIPLTVTANGNTVAVRLPSHPIAQMLIKTAQCPIAAPSANLFSRPSPTTAQHVWDDLAGKISMIIDAGESDIGIESTVLDITQSPPCMLRPGGIFLERLKSIIPDIQIDRKYLNMHEHHSPPRSPGQIAKHYAPNAHLLVFVENTLEQRLRYMNDLLNKKLKERKTVGLMLNEEHIPMFKKYSCNQVIIENMGSINNLNGMAKRLFNSMRRLDAQWVDYIFMCIPAENALGLAMNDRLFRAAYKVYHLS